MSELNIKEVIVSIADEMVKEASELPVEERYFQEDVAAEMVKIASDESMTPEMVEATIRVESNHMEKAASLTSDAAEGLIRKAVNAGQQNAQKIAREMLKNEPKLAFKKGLAQAGAAGVAGITALGALKAAKGIKDMREYGKYRSALDTAYKGNEVLSAMPEGQVRAIGDSIHRFAPTASQDPGLLRNILNNSVHAADGAIDANTIKMLTEIEDRINKRHQTNPNSITI